MSNLFSQCVRHSVFSIALIALLFVTSTPRAQPGVMPAQTQSASDRIELHQALLDLTNAWTVMCVAAHPDDEDGATLTVLRRKYGVHTVSLFSTFGEGGQNAIGPELYEELGAIRAQETLKAAEIQGSEPHFLGLKDFGFSKSAEEAFRIWGHDEALRRMVLQIRTLRPDVIITNHDTTSGHGHHQATGRLVLEAFDAAADPKRFLEQLTHAEVWQVQRLFVRLSAATAGSSDNASSSKVFTIDRNELDPVRGTTFAEQALAALQQHASQGPWPKSVPKEGMPPIRYGLVRESGITTLPSNAKMFLDDLTESKEISSYLVSLRLEGRPLVDFVDQRERVRDALVNAYRFWNSTNELRLSDRAKLLLLFKRFNSALGRASGLVIDVSTKNPTLLRQERTTFDVKFTNNGTKEVLLRSGFVGMDELDHETVRLKLPARLAPTSSVRLSAAMLVEPGTPITVPHAAHLYDDLWRGWQYVASIHVEIDGAKFDLTSILRHDVAPSVEIATLAPTRYVFTPANLSKPLEFRVRLKNNQNKPFKGQFGIESPTDHGTEIGAEIALAVNEAREFTIRSNVIPVDTPDEKRTPRNDFGPIIIRVHPWESSTIISEQEISVVYSDARVTPNLRVGYMRSFDDTLRDSLVALGVESRELSIDDIRTGDLQSYDSIIIDNRGYLAHPELVDANSRLMDYAKNGGNLIVFYHRTDEWNPDAAKNRPSLAPFPITLGNERVTDENAMVTFLDPLHPLLNSPNKIGPDDFKGWIQERGLYYPKSWDPRYQSLFAMSDAGEKPLRGGLLVTKYGKGHYIYTSMVWYRQLRAGVRGGYRMFANMISYGHRVV